MSGRSSSLVPKKRSRVVFFGHIGSSRRPSGPPLVKTRWWSIVTCCGMTLPSASTQPRVHPDDRPGDLGRLHRGGGLERGVRADLEGLRALDVGGERRVRPVLGRRWGDRHRGGARRGRQREQQRHDCEEPDHLADSQHDAVDAGPARYGCAPPWRPADMNVPPRGRANAHRTPLAVERMHPPQDLDRHRRRGARDPGRRSGRRRRGAPPSPVSGEATAAPHVLFADGAGTVAFSGPGASFARPVLHAPLDGSAQADRVAGREGLRHHLRRRSRAATARSTSAPTARSACSSARPPGRTGRGARRCADPRPAVRGRPPRPAAVFSTFGAGSPGNVYLVRQTGQTLGPTQRLSGRGHIRRSPSPPTPDGDILVAWDRSRHDRGALLVRRLAAALRRQGARQDRRARSSSASRWATTGERSSAGSISASARARPRRAPPGPRPAPPRAGFAAPKQLDTYGNNDIAGGVGVRGLRARAWDRLLRAPTAVKAALVNGRSISAPQAIAPVAPDQSFADIGLGDLATQRGRQGRRRRRRQGPDLGRAVRRHRVRRAGGRLRVPSRSRTSRRSRSAARRRPRVAVDAYAC